MRTIKKTLKLLLLGIVLLALSIGYRLLWEKKRTGSGKNLLGLSQAKADAPPNGSSNSSSNSGSNSGSSDSCGCGNSG